MILTRNWLNDFVDLSDISLDVLLKSLNNVGLEVEECKSIKAPNGVVVGYVTECIKHESADKLSVCQVDIGSEVLQIVCGAKNVKKGIYVGVATIGTDLGGDFIIKKSKLRGVDSNGMICSSNEIGFNAISNGIMILDESVGELKLGKALNSYVAFCDDIIEIDITPNRGDCLNILGIAKDLCAKLNLKLKDLPTHNFNNFFSDDIANMIKVNQENDINSSCSYKVISNPKIPLFVSLMISNTEDILELSSHNVLAKYIGHSTGVILNTYALSKEINEISIKKDKYNLDNLYINDDLCSTLGVNRFDKDINSDLTLLEASYQEPINLCKTVVLNKIKTDTSLYYKSSRGSNSDLNLAMEYYLYICSKYNIDIKISKDSVDINNNEKINKKLEISFSKINDILGTQIPFEQMTDMLLKLDFKVNKKSDELFVINIPNTRHDITSIQDIAEEILRIYDINNIVSKPLEIKQIAYKSDSLNKYFFKRDLRNKCANSGFCENISFMFCSKQDLEDYGFDTFNESVDIANPITSDLNTLRSSILPNLLKAVVFNKNNNFESINLFEIGSIFDKNRNESNCLSFISSGLLEKASIHNGAKPQNIDFFSFSKKLKLALPNIRFEKLKNISNNLINPYQSASIYIDDKKIGYFSKLHPKVQKSLKIQDTFIAEINLDVLSSISNKKTFDKVSKYPTVSRELSLLVDNDILYADIRDCIESSNIKYLKSFNVIDIFKIDENQTSFSVRFYLQSHEKTLGEEDINSIVMDNIFTFLSQKLNARLREN